MKVKHLWLLLRSNELKYLKWWFETPLHTLLSQVESLTDLVNALKKSMKIKNLEHAAVAALFV